MTPSLETPDFKDIHEWMRRLADRLLDQSRPVESLTVAGVRLDGGELRLEESHES